MDVTGAYVGTGSVGEKGSNNPTSSLGVINKSHNQVTSGSVIQLQINIQEKFIPALFYGIIQGGTALNVWRDGAEVGDVKSLKFSETVWGPVIKGPNGVFAKIDKMLPIIRQSDDVAWRVTSNNKNIRIGKRDLNGEHYLILSNHSDKPENITLSFEGINSTQALDYFSNTKIGELNNGRLDVNIGYHNNGYKVIKLVQ